MLEEQTRMKYLENKYKMSNDESFDLLYAKMIKLTRYSDEEDAPPSFFVFVLFVCF